MTAGSSMVAIVVTGPPQVTDSLVDGKDPPEPLGPSYAA